MSRYYFGVHFDEVKNLKGVGVEGGASASSDIPTSLVSNTPGRWVKRRSRGSKSVAKARRRIGLGSQLYDRWGIDLRGEKPGGYGFRGRWNTWSQKYRLPGGANLRSCAARAFGFESKTAREEGVRRRILLSGRNKTLKVKAHECSGVKCLREVVGVA
jgi:hypothetical protein